MLRGIPKLGVLEGIAGDTAPDHKCEAKEGATLLNTNMGPEPWLLVP